MKNKLNLSIIFILLSLCTFNVSGQPDATGHTMLYIHFTDAPIADSIMIDYLSSIGYAVSAYGCDAPDLPLTGYDIVVISETIASSNSVWAKFKEAPMPFVTFKVHAIKDIALNWTAQAPINDQTYNNTTETTLTVKDPYHPIFRNLPDKNEVKVFNEFNGLIALLSWAWINPNEMTGSAVLSTINGVTVGLGDGAGQEVQNIIAFDSLAVVNGNTLNNRAVILGFHQYGWSELTADGLLLIANACEWVRTGNVKVEVPVTDVEITGAADITIDNGTLQLDVNILPIDATIKKVTWKSSDGRIATVNGAGLVTAVANGYVKIIASATDGSYKADTVTINVSGQPDATGRAMLYIHDPYYFTDAPIADSIMIDYLSSIGYAVSAYGCDAPDLPLTGYDIVVISETIASSNSVWAKFKEAPMPFVTFKVHAIKDIALNWTAQAPINDQTYNNTTETTLTVKDPYHPIFRNLPDKNEVKVFNEFNGLIALLSWAWINPNEMTGSAVLSTINGVTVGLGDGAGQEVQNIIAFDSLAVVNGNTLNNRAVILGFHQYGWSELTADGLLLIANACEWVRTGNVKVEVPVTDVEITGAADITIDNGTLQLDVNILPIDATIKKVTWKSSDGRIATVNGAGLVTAVANGDVKIIATANDGSGEADTVNITISGQIISVTGVNISGIDSVLVGETITLTANITPDNATDKSVTWSVDKIEFATIDATSGMLTGKTAGDVVVTATTKDGNKTATKNVKVVAVTSIATFADEQFKFYPNPTTGLLFISNASNINKIEILDVSGKLELTVFNSNAEIQLNVSQLKAGMYIIRAYTSDNVYVTKFIKK